MPKGEYLLYMTPEESKLREIIRRYASLAIAFSGGTDSTLLATITHDVLGDRLLLVHLESSLAPYHESEFAKKWAKENGTRIKMIQADPLSVPDIVKNSKQRCYYCKRYIMSTILKEAETEGISTVADGTNLDDYEEYRPGLSATEELGIEHPLAIAGFNKHKIRKLAQFYGLENWNTPPAACLATRIPYHTPLDKRDLKRAGDSEEYLRGLGIAGSRIRIMDDTARIETSPSDFHLLINHHQEVVQKLKNQGFKLILLDLEGYKHGVFDG